jgi:hypothetical protein
MDTSGFGIAPKQWALNAPSVVSETIEGEAIVINLETGCYYSLAGIAGEWWDFLLESGRCDQARSWLASRYDAPPDALVAAWDEFVGKLVDEQLIREVPPQVEAGELPPPGGMKQTFAAPLIHKFEDMKEMLLLDPIHDVAAGGWPNLPDGQ